jgi:hypothetical protein
MGSHLWTKWDPIKQMYMSCIFKNLIILYRPDDDPHEGSKHVAWDTLLNIVNFIKLCCVRWIILSS